MRQISCLSFLFIVLSIPALAQDLQSIPFQLPLFVIDTDDQEILDEPKIDGHLGITNNADSPNFYGDDFNEYDGKIGIEIRGNGSKNFPKNSYLFETRKADGENLNISLLGFPEENDWVLYGPYIDITGMRNTLTYELSRAMGHYASRSEFIEVILNGKYIGVFVLMEKLKRDKNRVDINKFKSEEVNDPTAGGYFFKIDSYWLEEWGWLSNVYEEGDRTWQTDYQYLYPEPEDISDAQATYLKEFMHEIDEGFFYPSSNGLKDLFDNYINIESFIDLFLINELTKNPDGYRLSTYMTIDPTADDPRLHLGPVWDYNFGYGNYVNNFGVVKNWEYDNHWWPVWNNIPFWWIRAMDDDYFKNALVCRWQELRKEIITPDGLEKQIEQLDDQIREAMLRNHEQWPTADIIDYVSWASTKDYYTEVKLLKEWIPGRIKWMDININALAPDKLKNFIVDVLRPNPTYNGFTIDLEIEKDQDVEILIFDTSGRLIYEKVNPLIKGAQRVEVYDASLARGTYFVTIQSEQQYIIEKLICL